MVILPSCLERTVEQKIVTDIDKQQWIWVPGTNKFVSVGQSYNNLRWNPALTTVLRETPFVVPSPAIFMPHYTNVCASVRKRNPQPIYDGAHEPLSRSRRNDLYERRTTKTWISLDAYFKKQKGKLLLATDHHLVNGVLKPQTLQPLEQRVEGNDILVDLHWNRQGLPIKRSKIGEYTRGENLIFYQPAAGCVAWFCAVSGRAVLCCVEDLQFSDASLGVLLCAEGAAKK